MLYCDASLLGQEQAHSFVCIEMTRHVAVRYSETWKADEDITYYLILHEQGLNCSLDPK